MTKLLASILSVGLLTGLGVISYGLYYQFGRTKSSFTRLTQNDLTQEWQLLMDSEFIPFVTDINGQLIHVWILENGKVIHLESTASSCRISLDEHRRVKLPLQAVGTAIGNVVVALVEENLVTGEESVKIYSFHNRYECRVSVITDIETDAVFLVGQHYTFDVFWKNETYCGWNRICRRSYEGNTGKAFRPDTNATDLIVESDLWSIDAVKKFSPTSGFIYQQISPYDTLSIQRLDSELKVLAERQWYDVQVYSTEHGRISLCVNQNGTTSLGCYLADAELKSVNEKAIDLPVDSDMRDLQLHNLPDGGAIALWVGLAKHQVLYKRDTLVIRMRIIDPQGQVSQPIELLDHNICKEYDIRSIEVYHGLCFRIACLTGVSVKCIVPDKDQLFHWV